MNLTSPRDWKFSDLQGLDCSLRCTICKEYFQTAMMLPCSHNFCSLCIRRHLEYTCNRSLCPFCSTPCIASELVNNRLVDQLVKQFAAVRSYLLKLEDGLSNPKVGDKVAVTTTTHHFSESVSTRVSAKTTAVFNETVSLQEQLETNVAKKDDVEPLVTSLRQPVEPTCDGPLISGKESRDVSMREKTPELKQDKTDSNVSPTVTDEQVSCPVCHDSMPQRHINAHLDKCLHKQSHQEQLSQASTHCSSVRDAKNGVKRLPKLIYTMPLLPDKELNRKLIELGLPTSGNRRVRVKRHQEFTLMYNVECDKESPRTIKEVAKEFLRIETDKMKASEEPMTTGGRIVSKIAPTQGESEKQRHRLRSNYTREHDSSFKKLIDEVRNRKAKVSGNNDDPADSHHGNEKSSVTTTQINTSLPDENIDGDSEEFEDDRLLPFVTKSSTRRRINSSGSSPHSPAESGQRHGEVMNKPLRSTTPRSDDEMPASQSILVTNNEKLESTTSIDDHDQTLTGGLKLLQDGPPDNLTQLLNDDLTSIPDSPPHQNNHKDVDYQSNANLLSDDDSTEEPAPKRRSLRTRQNPRRATRYSASESK